MIDFDEMAAGLNKRRIIQRAVFNELCRVCVVLLREYEMSFIESLLSSHITEKLIILALRPLLVSSLWIPAWCRGRQQRAART